MLRRPRAWLLLLLLLCWWPALWNGFHADDFDWLSSCTQARERGELLPADVNAHLRPLVDLGWALQFRLFGLQPLGYHAAGLLMHLLLALLVGRLARSLSGEAWLGPVAALLYGVDFGARSAVGWVAALPDRMLALLAAAALLAWCGWGRRRARALAGLLLGCAALLVKENGLAVLLGLVLASLLLAQAPRGRWLTAAVLATLAGGLLVSTAARSNVYLEGRFEAGAHVPLRLLEALAGLAVPMPTQAPLWALGLGTLTWLTLLGLAARRRPRACLLLAGFALLSVAPALMSRDVMESRWLYPPLVGFAVVEALALAILAGWLERRHGPRLSRGRVVAWLLVAHVLAHGTLIQLKLRRDARRDAAVAWRVERAAEAAGELPTGAELVVLCEPGSELRWWPLGAELVSGGGRGVRALHWPRGLSRPSAPAVLDLRGFCGDSGPWERNR